MTAPFLRYQGALANLVRAGSAHRIPLARQSHAQDLFKVEPWAPLPVNLMPKREMKERRRVKGTYGVLAARNPLTVTPGDVQSRIDAR